MDVYGYVPSDAMIEGELAHSIALLWVPRLDG